MQMLRLYITVAKLQEDKDKADKDADVHDYNEGEFDKILYMNYRNLLIHLTNIILSFQVIVAGKMYDDYNDKKLKYDDQKKKA